MTKTIQLRNVPHALHRRLKSRAARAGMSLSDYLLHQVRKVANQPTIEEMKARLARRPTAVSSIDLTGGVRSKRDNR